MVPLVEYALTGHLLDLRRSKFFSRVVAVDVDDEIERLGVLPGFEHHFVEHGTLVVHGDVEFHDQVKPTFAVTRTDDAEFYSVDISNIALLDTGWFEKVMKDFNRDHWMDADESVKYGIVDGVLE